MFLCQEAEADDTHRTNSLRTVRACVCVCVWISQWFNSLLLIILCHTYNNTHVLHIIILIHLQILWVREETAGAAHRPHRRRRRSEATVYLIHINENIEHELDTCLCQTDNEIEWNDQKNLVQCVYCALLVSNKCTDLLHSSVKRQ